MQEKNNFESVLSFNCNIYSSILDNISRYGRKCFRLSDSSLVENKKGRGDEIQVALKYNGFILVTEADTFYWYNFLNKFT